MPNINDAFPSQYLAVADLQGRSVRVVIDTVTKETIGQGRDADVKLVATLVGKKKTFVINKTNAKAIAQHHGPDYDLWSGKTITLTPRQVEFQGDTVWAIRVDTPMPGVAIGTPVDSLPPKAAATPASAPAAPAADDDMPF